MAFWGVELKPGKPYCHISSKTSGRLRLTQATFGFGISNKRSFVQCNVGNKSPVLLCCLLPEKSECCQLDLEFDEEDQVVFSIIGPRSVHLTGYYLSSDSRHRGFDDSSESYGEDIGHSDTEKSNCSEEDDYEDSFINDGDVKVSTPSSTFSDEEMEEEMVASKKSSKKKASPHRRRLRKCQISESEDDASLSLKVVSNEDEDKIPISSLIKSGGTAKVEVDDNMVDSSNGNADKSYGTNGVVDGDIRRDADIQNEGDLKSVKKKSKKRQKKGNAVPPESTANNNETNEKREEPANDKKADADAPESNSNERNSKRKKRKINEDLASVEKQSKDNKKSSSSALRTLSNGLIVEELEFGKPDGEVASLGRKVKIHYTGVLKEGGRVYDTNIGSDPLKFRLGKGKAIEGLQLGLEGMRVGGRRRLTIPPELGYGRQGFADAVPPNSWLRMDIELLNVR